MPQPIRAVAYYRMSTDRQEDSIHRQKSQVEPYAAKKGYIIVHEYVDEGIAGDEAEKRQAFMRMLRDAGRREFQVILCDDKDRFGRFDSISYGYYVKPLRDAGVYVDTAAQGVIDWSSFAGRITDAVLQEARHLESQANSRRVLSMQLLAAENGEHTGGKTPYGYLLVTKEGRKVYVADGRKAEVVQLIFRMYDEGHTLNEICRELWKRGVLSPAGRPRWSRNGVLNILNKRKYVGDWTWGERAVGKYHRNKKGKLEARARGSARTEQNPPEDWIVKVDNHEPLIERAVFERVQARLRDNCRCKQKAPGSVGNFALSRLLVCGECGSLLQGWTRKSRSNGTSKIGYRCSGYSTYGEGHCHYNPIDEKPLLNVILRKLQQAFLNPANLQKLRAEMRRIETDEKSQPNRDRLRNEYEALQAKVDQAYDKLAILPVELARGLGEKMSDWKRQADALQQELKRIEKDRPADALEEKIKAAEACLWRLQEALQAEDSVRLREVLRQIITKIELFWTHEPARKTIRSKLLRGVISLRPQEESSGITLSTASDAARALRAAGAARVFVAVLAHSQG